MAETKLVTDPHGRQGYVTYGDGRFTITVEPISMKLLLDEIADAASELAATERATLGARVEALEGALEHIKAWPCPTCMPEQPDELCPLHIAIKDYEGGRA